MPVCYDEELPETDFDFCEPDVHLSEIQRVFLALPESEGFDDWSNRVEWLGRLTQSGTGVNAIRTLTCIGDKPAPNSIKKSISLGRTKITSKTHTLFITIDEVSDLNHAFVQKLKNGKKFRMWYESAGEFMFGGVDGILVTVYGDMVLLRGKGEVITYELQVVWENLRTEDRIQSPIFGLGPADATCSTIGELTSSDVTATSMTISWDAVPAARYQWGINTTGDVPDDWTNIPPTLTEIAITGLTEATEYFIFVRAVCYNGSIGNWEGTRGTTAAAVHDIPYYGSLIAGYLSDRGITLLPTTTRITAWADQSPHGNDLVINDPTPTPDLVAAHFNSYPSVHFPEATVKQLATVNNIAGHTNRGLFTMFVVLQPGPVVGPTTDAFLINYAETPTQNGFILGRKGYDPTLNVIAIDNYSPVSDGNVSCLVNVPSASKHVYAVTVNRSLIEAAKVNLYSDGHSTGAKALSGFDYFSLFPNGKLIVGLTVEANVAAILMYDVEMTPTQVSEVSTYLSGLFL